MHVRITHSGSSGRTYLFKYWLNFRALKIVRSIITVPSLYFANNGLHTHLLFSAQEVRAWLRP